MSNSKENDVQIPVFISGLVTKDGVGFCMDGAEFRLAVMDNVVARLKPTNDEARACLEHLAGTRQKVAVAGTSVTGAECSHLAVYYAAPTTAVLSQLKIALGQNPSS